MTASLVSYRNVQIVSPNPTGAAGLALNNNFIALADQTAALTTSIASVLPDQTANSGKFLTTNGTTASWATLSTSGFLVASNNLSDLANAATARTNLGLGTAATTAASSYDSSGAASSAVATHAALTSTHGVSGAIVGTSDVQSITNKTITDATNNISASVLTSGTVPTARLGSGPASSTTFLRGDQTWATVTSGAVSSVTNGNGLTLSGGVLSFSGAGYDASGTASSAVSTHAALTATHGVSGAIVGTTDTQTLTNKTISQSQITGLTTSLAGLLPLAGGTMTGDLVLGTNNRLVAGDMSILGDDHDLYINNNDNTFLTLTDSGIVQTFNNTLDDGSGGMNVVGSFQSDGGQVYTDGSGAFSTGKFASDGASVVTDGSGNLAANSLTAPYIYGGYINGNRLLPISTVTANTTISATDVNGISTFANSVYLINAASTVTVTLPQIGNTDNHALSGQTFTIKTIQSAATVKTSSSGQKIDGTDYSSSGYSLSAANKFITIVSDGSTNWYIVASN